MAEKHPDELALLSFVEEELDDAGRQEVSEHLVACRACSGQVRRLEAGRAALRASPLLELPAERRDEIMAALPERRDPWRRFRPARRVLVVAAPVAAAACLVGVFVLAGTQLGGGGDDDESAGSALESSADERGEEGAPAAGQDAVTTVQELDQPAGFVRAVQGPPADVVRLLRREGIEAEAAQDGSVRAEARRVDVEAALAGRPAGDVAVYVK
jgi:anti-sigma factor RsiW